MNAASLLAYSNLFSAGGFLVYLVALAVSRQLRTVEGKENDALVNLRALMVFALVLQYGRGFWRAWHNFPPSIAGSYFVLFVGCCAWACALVLLRRLWRRAAREVGQ